MASKPAPRIVHMECPTPLLYRWFLNAVSKFTSKTSDGFVVHDEAKWSEALIAAEGRELSHTVTVRQITLTIRDGQVVGAMGSDPERFMGLTEADARKLAGKR